MKKYLLLILPFIVVLNSCKKIDGSEVNSSALAVYQPLTSGSTWTYSEDFTALGYGMDTTIVAMSSQVSTINNIAYRQAYSYPPAYPSLLDTGYYYAKNHEYSLQQTIAISVNGNTAAYAYDMLYLKDNLPVGSTWSTNTATLTLKGKIVEKGISKTVAGKTYTNVIHTNVAVTINAQSVTGTNVYDMYLAPGIGIIRTELGDGTGTTTVIQNLIAYTIK